MSSNQFEISIQKRKLKFIGNSCEECRPLCQALCCRYPWDIKLTREEFQSGQFDAQVICLLSKGACKKTTVYCAYQLFKMVKKPDNSCIYLDENNYCSIHEIRPQVCRDWSCDYSFALAPKRKPENKLDADAQGVTPSIDGEIKNSAVFIPYPFERLLTVVYVNSKSKLYFIRECIQGCERYYSEVDFDYPDMDDNKIQGLINQFNQKYSLSRIRQKYNQQYDQDISEVEFRDIVSILIKQRLIIDIYRLIQ